MSEAVNEALLEKMRKMNRVLQTVGGIVALDEKSEQQLPFTNLTHILGDILEANTYLIDEKGKLLGFYEKHAINNARVKQMLADTQFPKDYAYSMLEITRTTANIDIESDYTVFPVESRDTVEAGLTTIIPIFAAGERLATLILARETPRFDNSDLILGEHASIIVGIEVLNTKKQHSEKEARDGAMVEGALNTLSYSELKAVKAIFEALDGIEGRITAANVADEVGVTRSVIVNALRKLESGGIIESRSLGMKGTYIRIKNEKLLGILGNDKM